MDFNFLLLIVWFFQHGVAVHLSSAASPKVQVDWNYMQRDPLKELVRVVYYPNRPQVSSHFTGSGARENVEKKLSPRLRLDGVKTDLDLYASIRGNGVTKTNLVETFAPDAFLHKFPDDYKASSSRNNFFKNFNPDSAKMQVRCLERTQIPQHKENEEFKFFTERYQKLHAGRRGRKPTDGVCMLHFSIDVPMEHRKEEDEFDKFDFTIFLQQDRLFHEQFWNEQQELTMLELHNKFQHHFTTLYQVHAPDLMLNVLKFVKFEAFANSTYHPQPNSMMKVSAAMFAMKALLQVDQQLSLLEEHRVSSPSVQQIENMLKAWVVFFLQNSFAEELKIPEEYWPFHYETYVFTIKQGEEEQVRFEWKGETNELAWSHLIGTNLNGSEGIAKPIWEWDASEWRGIVDAFEKVFVFCDRSIANDAVQQGVIWFGQKFVSLSRNGTAQQPQMVSTPETPTLDYSQRVFQDLTSLEIVPPSFQQIDMARQMHPGHDKGVQFPEVSGWKCSHCLYLGNHKQKRRCDHCGRLREEFAPPLWLPAEKFKMESLPPSLDLDRTDSPDSWYQATTDSESPGLFPDQAENVAIPSAALGHAAVQTSSTPKKLKGGNRILKQKKKAARMIQAFIRGWSARHPKPVAEDHVKSDQNVQEAKFGTDALFRMYDTREKVQHSQMAAEAVHQWRQTSAATTAEAQPVEVTQLVDLPDASKKKKGRRGKKKKKAATEQDDADEAAIAEAASHFHTMQCRKEYLPYETSRLINCFKKEKVASQSSILKILRKGDADPKATIGEQPVLIQAINNGYEDAALELLKQGAYPKISNLRMECAVLSCAFVHKQWRVVEELIKLKDDNTPSLRIKTDKTDSTLLIGLIKFGQERLVHLLLAPENLKKHDINARDSSGETALFIAAQHGLANTVSALLTAGAESTPNISKGLTPLMACLITNEVDTFWMFIVHQNSLDFAGPGVDILLNHFDNKGHSVLHYAMAANLGDHHFKMVEALLAAGATYISQDKKNWRSPLMIASTDHHHIRCATAILNQAEKDGRLSAVLRQTDRDGWNAFLIACVHGHADLVKLYTSRCTKGDNMYNLYPFERDSEGRTGLLLAAREGHADVVRSLLSLMAREETIALANYQDNSGSTPLHYSAQFNHEGITKQLLDAGAVFLKDNIGRDPLFRAVEAGGMNIIRILFEFNGKEVNERDAEFKTLLHLAVENNQVEALKLFLEEGHEGKYLMHMQDASFRTVLKYAAVHDNLDALSVLIENGAKVYAYDGSESELHIAAEKGFREITEKLLSILSEPQDVNAQNSNGETPLFLASKHGHTRVAERLINNGADFRPNKFGQTPVHIATEQKHFEVLMFFMQAHIHDMLDVINLRDCDGKTALMVSIEQGAYRPEYFGVMDILLSLGADFTSDLKASKSPNAQIFMKLIESQYRSRNGFDVSTVDDAGNAAIHYASRMKNDDALQVITELLQLDEQIVDAKDSIGRTALHLICETFSKGADQIVQILIENDANLQAMDNEYVTPLMLCAKSDSFECADLILSADMDAETNSNLLDSFNRGAFFYACQESADGYLVDLLIAHGVSVSVPDWQGTTPLMLAASAGKAKVVDSILHAPTFGQDSGVNAQDPSGATALFFACAKGDSGIVASLLGAGADLKIMVTNMPTSTKFHLTNTVDWKQMSCLDIAEIKQRKEVVALLTGKEEISGMEQFLTVLKQLHQRKATGTFSSDVEKVQKMKRFILSDKYDHTYVDEDGCTAFHVATMLKEHTILNWMLEKANAQRIQWQIGKQNKAGVHALHYAVGNDDTFAVELMLSGIRGVDSPASSFNLVLDAQEPENNDTCLTMALHKENFTVFNLLLGAGANPNICNNEGDYPIHLATTLANTMPPFLHLLLGNSKKVNVNVANKLGYTALHKACIADNLEAAKALVDENADVDIRLPSGENALMIAAMFDSIRVFDYLISEGGADSFENCKAALQTIKENQEKKAFKVFEFLESHMHHKYVLPHDEKHMVRAMADTIMAAGSVKAMDKLWDESESVIMDNDELLFLYQSRYSELKLGMDKDTNALFLALDGARQMENPMHKNDMLQTVQYIIQETKPDMTHPEIRRLMDELRLKSPKTDPKADSEKPKTQAAPASTPTQSKSSKSDKKKVKHKIKYNSKDTKHLATCLELALWKPEGPDRDKFLAEAIFLLHHHQKNPKKNKNPDPNAVSSNGTPVIRLAVLLDAELTHLLICRGAYDDSPEFIDHVLNRMPIQSIDLVLTKFIEKHGTIDFDFDSNPDNHPFRLALQTGKPEVLQVVISKGAHVNWQVPCNGASAMHLLLTGDFKSNDSYRMKMAQILIHCGIDLSLVDANGFTPLQMAVKTNQEVFVAMMLSSSQFKEKPALINQETRHHSALFLAASCGLNKIANRLLNAAAHPRLGDNKHTPLTIAIERNHLQVVKCILEHCPSDIDEVNPQLLTPLDVAMKNGDEKMMSFISRKLGEKLQI